MTDIARSALEAMLSVGRDPLVVMDEGGAILEISAAAARLIGAHPHGLAARNLSAALASSPHASHVHFAGLGEEFAADIHPAPKSATRLVRVTRVHDRQEPVDHGLMTFIDHLPAAVLLLDGNGTVCAQNRAATGLQSARPGEQGAVLRDLDAEGLAWNSPRPVIGSEVIGEGEAAREYRVVRFRIDPSDVGERPRLAVIFLDVTEQRNAEARLRESEGRLAAFMNHAPVAMYLKEVGGRYVVVNRRMEEVVVSGVGAILGRTTREVFNPIAAEFIEAADRKVVETGAAEVGEEHYAGADDFQYTFTTRFPVRDAEGRITHIGGVLIDTTPLKRAERRILETEQRLSAFLAHAPFGMFLKNAQGEMLLSNPEMGRIVEPDLTLIDGESPESVAERESEVIHSGDVALTEWRRPGRRAYEWTLVIRFPAPSDGGLPNLGGFVLDLSDRKAAEQELERSREALHQSEKVRALGTLLAGVSHELNNPLSAILANAVMLEEDLETTPLGPRAARIRLAAERCARIVQVFLAMARQKPPHRAPVRLVDVVSAAVEITSYGLRMAQVQVDAEIPADLPDLWADADQLHQVLVNLLVNAQQALEGADGDRRVRLRARVANGTVQLDVEDTGPGVPAPMQERIFEPFYTSKPQGVGTGLGLSVSRGIMEGHGGSLELLPSHDGARFRLQLPLTAPNSEELGEIEGPEDVLSPGTALIVEDDPDVAQALADLLRRDGYSVDWASGQNSLARLRETDHDVVICDLKMPANDGPAFMAWLARVRPDLVERIGFVTGDVAGQAAYDYLLACGRPFTEKPFTRTSIRRLLSALRSRAEGESTAPPAS